MESRYQGIVINKYDCGEADRFYVLFTREAGKVKLRAVGVRKSSSKMAGNLENFCLVSLTAVRRKGTGRISNVIIEEHFPVLRSSFSALWAAFSACFSLEKALPEGQKEEKVFFLLKDFLDLLNQKENQTDLKVGLLEGGFFIQALALLGFKPQVFSCVKCDRKLPANSSYFDPQEGGVVCRRCFPFLKAERIKDNTIKLMRLALTSCLSSLLKLKADKEEIEEFGKMAVIFWKWNFS